MSLRALRRIPRERYPALLANFASFMPSGGPLLLALAPRPRDGIDTDPHGATEESNSEIIERAGMSIIADGIDRSGDETYQIILARS